MPVKELQHLLKDKAKSIGEFSKTADLAQALSDVMKSEGAEEKSYDINKALEQKSAMLETKANEVVHTSNTGFGAELIQGNILLADFLDLAPKMDDILGQFRGYHGRNLPKQCTEAIIGELPLHNIAPEWTTGTPPSMIAQGLGKLPTGSVTLNQKKFFFSVDVSDEEVKFASIVDLLAHIQMKLAGSSARTTVSAIINGDTATGANTNINLIDGTPVGTEHYLAGNGLRKKTFASASTSFDAGTFDFSDFLLPINALGENAANTDDLLWLFSRFSHTTALGIAEFKQQYINGSYSTVNTGKLQSFLGSDLYVNRYVGKANAVGKVSATPANNVKGQALLVHRDAVQYGYSGDYNIELFRVPGFGWQVIGYYYMGFDVVGGQAGTDPLVASLYNIS